MLPDPAATPADSNAVLRHLRAGEEAARAAASESGAARAVCLQHAARAFFAAGEEGRGRAALRAAYDASPADDGLFVAALRDGMAEIDRLACVLEARARAVPSEWVSCHRARADALLAFGRTGAAVEAYRTCLALAPDDPGALAGLAEALAEVRRGDSRDVGAEAEAAR